MGDGGAMLGGWLDCWCITRECPSLSLTSCLESPPGRLIIYATAPHCFSPTTESLLAGGVYFCKASRFYLPTWGGSSDVTYSNDDNDQPQGFSIFYQPVRAISHEERTFNQDLINTLAQ